MSSEPNWVSETDPSVFKFLKKIPLRDKIRILDALGGLHLNPFFGDIQKMKGYENTWRRRIGVYRFFFKLFPERKVILIFHIERRSSHTY